MVNQRIRNVTLRDKIVTAEEAQQLIQNGMTVGVSGFTKSGDAKAVPRAIVDRIQKTKEELKINLYSGASLGATDTILAQCGVVNLRLPYQGDPVMRQSINDGNMYYMDQHLSHTSEFLRSGSLGEVDVAIIEATAITEDGGIVPTTSVGNSPIFVEQAKKVIVELNEGIPEAFEGLHDVYLPGRRPNRSPIPITDVRDRIGVPYIPCDPSKIAGIVLTNERDTPSKMELPDEDTKRMAQYILEFLAHEVRMGRLPKNLAPLQSGVGSVSNAVLNGLLDSPFSNLEIYTEVMQDSVFQLLAEGKVSFASSSSFTLSKSMLDHVLNHMSRYKEHIILRPQEISNHPEVVRRLGIIAMNTALEVDIYGNVNSTHVAGTRMMNGIGGSGDFARNAGLTIFVTKSTAKNDKVSSVVPFVSHVDHTEHDVDVLVTEQGIADLRGLAPRQRAKVVIENLAHPAYKEALLDYYKRAVAHGGHTPHLLNEALSWHTRFEEAGDMRVFRSLARVR